MTTDSLLAELRRRGLEVVVTTEGALALRGEKAQATPALLAVLRWHRGEIAKRLGIAVPAEVSRPVPPRLREWLWLGGMTYAEETAGLADEHPSLAVWWRYVGESDWQEIPGRNSGNAQPHQKRPEIETPAPAKQQLLTEVAP